MKEERFLVRHLKVARRKGTKMLGKHKEPENMGAGPQDTGVLTALLAARVAGLGIE